MFDLQYHYERPGILMLIRTLLAYVGRLAAYEGREDMVEDIEELLELIEKRWGKDLEQAFDSAIHRAIDESEKSDE